MNKALFKQIALARGRLIAEEAIVNNDMLMENLRLVDEECYLIFAAMLTFYRDPERWVTGVNIKISFSVIPILTCNIRTRYMAR